MHPPRRIGGCFCAYLSGENPCRYVAKRATRCLTDFCRIGFVASQNLLMIMVRTKKRNLLAFVPQGTYARVVASHLHEGHSFITQRIS